MKNALGNSSPEEMADLTVKLEKTYTLTPLIIVSAKRLGINPSDNDALTQLQVVITSVFALGYKNAKEETAPN